MSRVLAAVVAVLGLVLVAAPGASAHAVLASSDPSDGDQVETLPARITLTFNESVSAPAYVVVEAPDGTEVASGEAEVGDDSVVQTLHDEGIAGEYRISYRVVSADGHPVTGTVGFSVVEGRTVEATRDPSDADDGSGVGGFVHQHAAHLLWGAAGVVAAAALLLWPRRRPEDDDG